MSQHSRLGPREREALAALSKSWDSVGQALAGPFQPGSLPVINRQVARRLERRGLIYIEPFDMWWCGLTTVGESALDQLEEK